MYILSYLQHNGEGEGLLTLTTTTTTKINNKILHGKFQNSLQENHVDKESSSILWPSAGCICPEMEGFAVAIQDWVIKTRNYEKHRLEVEVTDRCRKCN